MIKITMETKKRKIDCYIFLLSSVIMKISPSNENIFEAIVRFYPRPRNIINRFHMRGSFKKNKNFKGTFANNRVEI